MKRLLKILPYLISVIIGVLFLFLSYKFSNNNIVNSLLINISASFFTITLVYLFYEIFKSYSHKKLTSSFYFYLKEQIDERILKIIGNLMCIVDNDWFLDPKNVHEKIFWDFVNINKEDLKKLLEENEHIGFYIFKSWFTTIDSLNDIINNPLLIKILTDEQVISLIDLRKSIQYLEVFHENKDIYVDTGKVLNKDIYKLIKASDLSDLCDLNALDKIHPKTGVLFKNINDSAIPICTGIIICRDINMPLNYFRINQKYIDKYTSEIMSVISGLKTWLMLTNKEFILDPERFKDVINNELVRNI